MKGVLTTGKIKSFALNIEELKVYKGDQELKMEENTYIN
jgi:hypothetical protein